MKLRTCGLAGSMPESIRARETWVFDNEFLRRCNPTNFQREVVNRLLRVMNSFSPESFSVRAGIGESGGGCRHDNGIGSTMIINIVPQRDESAEITIYIDPETFIDIGAGRETTFGLPHDVWDQRAKDAPGFTEKIVAAVMSGKLREMIYYRGEIPVRCESELDIDGVSLQVDRTDIGAFFRGFFRKRIKREVVYTPYDLKNSDMKSETVA